MGSDIVNSELVGDVRIDIVSVQAIVHLQTPRDWIALLLLRPRFCLDYVAEVEHREVGDGKLHHGDPVFLSQRSPECRQRNGQ